jgi:hypothetical protein
VKTAAHEKMLLRRRASDRAAMLEGATISELIADLGTATRPTINITSKHDRLLGRLRGQMLEQSRLCRVCVSRAVSLILHHRNYHNWGKETAHDVILLCAKCHVRVHS